ncbi:terpene synthase family protein [Streptomyces sp. NPDC001415]
MNDLFAPRIAADPSGWNPHLAAVLADLATTDAVIAAQLSKWAHGWGAPFSLGSVPLSAVYATHVAPWNPPEVTLMTAKTILWIATVDDWAERDDAAPRGLDHLQEVAEGKAPDPHSALAGALADIRDTVLGAASSRRRGSLWVKATTALLAGMKFEHVASAQIRDGGPPPALPLYLHHAGQTIGVPLTMATLWASAPQPACDSSLARLQPPLESASQAIRMANDLQSYERERRTGDLNAIALGASPAYLRTQIADQVRHCLEQLRPLLTHPCPDAQALHYCLHFVLRLHQAGDAGHLHEREQQQQEH